MFSCPSNTETVWWMHLSDSLRSSDTGLFYERNKQTRRETLIAGAFLEEPWRSWRSSETDPHGATAQGGVRAVAVAPAQIRAGGCLV